MVTSHTAAVCEATRYLPIARFCHVRCKAVPALLVEGVRPGTMNPSQLMLRPASLVTVFAT